jgi:hypothetical protein
VRDGLPGRAPFGEQPDQSTANRLTTRVFSLFSFLSLSLTSVSVLQYELYYTSDSTHLLEARSRTDWTPGSLSRPSLSAKTALCTDMIPISSITRHAQILSPSDPMPHRPQPKSSTPSFVVRKVFDAKPIAGAEFIGEIDWLDVYERGMTKGDWNVDAILEEEEEEEERVVIKREAIKKKARRPEYKDDLDSGDDSDESEGEEDFVSSSWWSDGGNGS